MVAHGGREKGEEKWKEEEEEEEEKGEEGEEESPRLSAWQMAARPRSWQNSEFEFCGRFRPAFPQLCRVLSDS
jgi:hypothetical protein